jgi:hypothetical protein
MSAKLINCDLNDFILINTHRLGKKAGKSVPKFKGLGHQWWPVGDAYTVV